MAFLVFLTALLATPFSWAETTPAKTAAATVSPTSAPLSAQEAQQLLNVLNDPKQRDSFTHTLSLMARGVKQTDTPAASPASKAATMPDVSPEIDNGLKSVRTQSLGYVHNFLNLFSDLGLVGHWFRSQMLLSLIHI